MKSCSWLKLERSGRILCNCNLYDFWLVSCDFLYGLVLAAGAVGEPTTVSLALHSTVNHLLRQQSEKGACEHEVCLSTKP